MKKFVKVLLIMAAVLGAVGIGFVTAGAAMGGVDVTKEALLELKEGDNPYMRLRKALRDHDWYDGDDFDDDYDDSNDKNNELDGTPVEADSNEADGSRVYDAGAVREIELNLEYDSLILENGDQDGVVVKVENDSKNNVEIAMDDDGLEIVSNHREDGRTITVSYPEDMQFESVDISMGAGEVSVNSPLKANEMELMVGAGAFHSAELLTAGEADLSVGAGEMTIDRLYAQEISGSCGLGQMTLGLSGTEKDYDYELEIGVGSISIGEQDYTSVAGEHVFGNQAGRSVELDCGMGTISVEFDGSAL